MAMLECVKSKFYKIVLWNNWFTASI